METSEALGTITTQRIARLLEIVNYILILLAIWPVFKFLAGPIIYESDLLIMKFAPIVLFALGLILHFWYFQHARKRVMGVTPQTLWGLSFTYNLLMAIYLRFFGSFAAIFLLWPICVAILSLVCLWDNYRQAH